MYKVKGKYGDKLTYYEYDENGRAIKDERTYDYLFTKFIYEPERELRVGCIVGDGDFKLTKEEMLSMNIELDAVNGGKFEFGCLGCAKLSLGIKYDAGLTKYDPEYRTVNVVVAKGDRLRPYIELKVAYDVKPGIQETEWLKVPLGVFVIEEIKTSYLTKTITAYDFAYAMDLGDMTDFPNYNAKPEVETEENKYNYFFFDVDLSKGEDGNIIKDANGNIPSKTTLQDVVNYINRSSDFVEIRNKMGIYQLNKDANGVTIPEKPYVHDIIDVAGLGLNSYMGIKLYDLGDNFTLRQFVGYLAGLQGKNAFFDKEGKLTFKKVVGRMSTYYDETLYGAISEDDTPMVTDAISCQFMVMQEKIDEQGNHTVELVPESVSHKSWDLAIDEYVFNNPLVSPYEQVNGGLLIERIYQAITNRTNSYTVLEDGKEVTKSYNVNKYIPCKFKLKGDPRIDINDVIVLKRKKKLQLDSDPLYQGDKIDVPVMKMKINLNGTCGLDIESVADSSRGGQTTSLSGSITKTLANTTSLAKGMFNELYGATGSFGSLFASDGKIGQLMSDKVSANEIFTKDLTTGEAYIDGAIIRNLSANAITGGTLNLSNGITIGSGDTKTTGGNDRPETLTINNRSIIMNSPKVDSDGHATGEYVERLFIGKRDNDGNPEYIIEIYNDKGDKLWGAEGLTSDAVNDLEDGTVSGEIIESLHATKVLLSKNFEHEETDDTETHTSLYNYLKRLNGENVTVTRGVKGSNTNEKEQVTLQTCLNDLEDRTTVVIGGNTNRINKLERKVNTLIDETIPALQDKDEDFQEEINTITYTTIPDIYTAVNGKVSNGNTIYDINHNALGTEKIGANKLDLSGVAPIDHTHDEYLTAIPEEYATQTFVIEKISEAQLSGETELILNPNTIVQLEENLQYTLSYYIDSKILAHEDTGEETPPTDIETSVNSLLERVGQLETENAALKEYNTALEERLALIESRISVLEGYHTTEEPDPEEPIDPNPEEPDPNPEEPIE